MSVLATSADAFVFAIQNQLDDVVEVEPARRGFIGSQDVGQLLRGKHMLKRIRSYILDKLEIRNGCVWRSNKSLRF